MDRSPSADEAAAIAAAVERFLAESAPVGVAEGTAIGPWQRAALVEGVGAGAPSSSI
ncbi:MAG: hypothetical protein WD404_01405 [Solirubrobacterales bacterium]